MKNQLIHLALCCLLLAKPASADLASGDAALEAGNYATALQQLLPLAKHGDAHAQYRVGQMYEQGLGVAQDKTAAKLWYDLAADQNLPEAQRVLGQMYLAEPEPRMGWFYRGLVPIRLTANLGDAKGEFFLGWYYLGGHYCCELNSAHSRIVGNALLEMSARHYPGDENMAQDMLDKNMRWFSVDEKNQVHALAEKLDVPGHLLENLNQYVSEHSCLHIANGAGNDECAKSNTAPAWLKHLALAEQGDVAAQYGVAEAYANGDEGTRINAAEAFKWYRRAAYQGLADAQYNLGLAYEDIGPVPSDTLLSVYWYTQAAEQGHELAQLKLADFYYHDESESGWEKPLEKNLVEAEKWYGRAADKLSIKGRLYFTEKYEEKVEQPVAAKILYAMYRSMQIIRPESVNPYTLSHYAKMLSKQQLQDAEALAEDMAKPDRFTADLHKAEQDLLEPAP